MLRTAPTAVLVGLMLLTASLAGEDSPRFQVDGSSTVYPISAAMAQDFQRSHPNAEIAVSFSGSSSGIRLLLAGEIPLAGASRPIKGKELTAAAERGLEVVELPIAYDGITVVVGLDNDFVDYLTVDELRAIWAPDSTITSWAQVRAGWPDEPLRLYGPGADSGTFEYFTKAIVGEAHASRVDYISSEDDVELVQGVVAHRGALAYFGFAYYLENEAMLRAVPIAAGDAAPVAPSTASIRDGSYTPLARPIFLYANAAELGQTAGFLGHYLDQAEAIVPQVGYVPLGSDAYALVRQRLEQGRTGSLFSGGGNGDVLATLRSGAVGVEPFRVDGSSTVYPISAAIGALHGRSHANHSIEVAFSGSSAGIRQLLAGDIPVAGASRPIKGKELTKAADAGMELIELPVAYDGITVVLNPSNTFVDYLTIDELRAIWAPDSSVRTWADVRAGWPNRPIELYGPGSDSGTFEYFTKAVVGEAGASRTDYHASEDDIELVQGVVANPYAIGYFGFAYYLENRAMLRAVPIKAGGEAVSPTTDSIRDGSYRPLSRPIFVYVNRASADTNAAVSAYIDTYLTEVAGIVGTVGYVPLSDQAYALISQRWSDRVTGSLFSNAGDRQVDAVLADSAGSSTPAVAAAPAARSPASTGPVLDGRAYQQTVSELRETSLQLARLSLDDQTTIGELQYRLSILQAQLEAIAAGRSAGAALAQP